MPADLGPLDSLGLLRLLGAGLGALGLFVATWYMLQASNESALERIRDRDQRTGRFEAYRVGLAPLRTVLTTMRGGLEERSRQPGKLAGKLMLAGLKVTPLEWLLVETAASAIVALLLLVRFQNPVAAVIGLAVGLAGMEGVLSWLRGRRRRAMESQVPPSLVAIGNALKAGQKFGRAVELLSQGAAPPLGPELMRVSREIALGVPVHTAVDHLVVRNQLEELRILVTALQIHSQVGGNLVEVIEGIEGTVRDRLRVKGEVRTLTTQARASGWVLGLLPIILAALLTVIAPSYFSPMFTDPLGVIMLIVAGVSMAIGCVAIQRISKVTY